MDQSSNESEGKMRFQSYLLEQSDRRFRIYLDMDGVIADFNTAFQRIDGRTTEEVSKEGDKAFWEHVDKGGLKFWSEMPWMPGSKKLWNYVKDKDVVILTAPARSLPNSPKGKKIWIQRELGNVKVIFKRAREKHEYADKVSVLIDDSESNIRNWKSAGGIGILFRSADQAIRELKKLEGQN